MIFVNVTVLACDHYGLEAELVWWPVYVFANELFLAVYVIEFALKLVGYGPVAYFLNEWCRFESPRCPGTEKRRHHCDCGSEDCGGGGSLC